MKKYFTLATLLLSVSWLNAQIQLKLVPFSQGYTRPLGIENCGDSRLFIVQQTGQIIVCDSTGHRHNTPFLDIKDRISNGSERGLLGLAFDPNYKTNGFFYVNYTDSNGNTQISRFRVSNSNRNKAVKASEKHILNITQPFANHNGGCTRFGPDGYLYIGMGDGGDAGDPNNNAQNPMSLLGKMIRIDVHQGNPYGIPASNPFVDSTNYRPEIWALGLRNPWRWSFDALTGALIIADVGQSTWEEVDRQKAGSPGGQNYGWRCYEGNHPFNTAGCKPQSAYTSPVFEYQHLNGDCSITGGFVYRGGQYPKLYGKYFCADYCSGFIRAVSIYASTVTAQTVYDGPANAYTAFGEDIHRELYVTDLTRGLIYRVTDSSAAPNIAGQYVPELFNIVPNPAKGNFNIVYQSATSQQVQVRVDNLVGQQFYAGTKSASPGKNIWRINIDLPAGNYYVTLTDHYGRVINQQLIIR